FRSRAFRASWWTNVRPYRPTGGKTRHSVRLLACGLGAPVALGTGTSRQNAVPAARLRKTPITKPARSEHWSIFQPFPLVPKPRLGTQPDETPFRDPCECSGNGASLPQFPNGVWEPGVLQCQRDKRIGLVMSFMYTALGSRFAVAARFLRW